MSFPLSSPGPGQPLPTDRQSWGEFVAAGRDAQRGRAGASAPRYAAQAPAPQTVIYVRNDTGGALDAFAVVKLGAPLLSATDDPHQLRQAPVLPGTAPGNYLDSFAVLIEPAPAGEIVRAAVLGLVPVDVYIATAGDQWAAPSSAGIVPGTGTAALLSRIDGGPAKIVSRESSGPGVVRCLVLLQGDMGGGVSPPPPAAGGGDVWGPDCAQTGQVALFTDPSGRFIGPARTLRFTETGNYAGGSTFAGDRSRLSLSMPGFEDDAYPRNQVFAQSLTGQWMVETYALRDAVNPLAGNLPAGSTQSTKHQAAYQFVLNRVLGTETESLFDDGFYEWFALDAKGGLCFAQRVYDFADVGTAFTEAMWYDAVALEGVRYYSYQVWMRHFTRTGVPGIGLSGTSFIDGLFVAAGPAVAPLTGTPTATDLMNKINELLGVLKLNVGILT